MLTLSLALLIGLCAGTASGFFGIGGGVIIVPLLAFWLGLNHSQATATSLAAMLLPVGLLGVLTYARAGHFQPQHWPLALLIALGLFIGAYCGARIAVQLPIEVLRKAFGVLLILIALRLFFGKS